VIGEGARPSAVSAALVSAGESALQGRRRPGPGAAGTDARGPPATPV